VPAALVSPVFPLLDLPGTRRRERAGSAQLGPRPVHSVLRELPGLLIGEPPRAQEAEQQLAGPTVVLSAVPVVLPFDVSLLVLQELVQGESQFPDGLGNSVGRPAYLFGLVAIHSYLRSYCRMPRRSR
jgi:hypothetical protein